MLSIDTPQPDSFANLITCGKSTTSSNGFVGDSKWIICAPGIAANISLVLARSTNLTMSFSLSCRFFKRVVVP